MRYVWIFLSFIIFVDPAMAEETPTYKLAPFMPEVQGKTIVQDGVEYKAFTFEEAKNLKRIYADYFWLYQRHAEIWHTYTIENNRRDIALQQVELCKSQLKMAEDSVERWKADFMQERKLNMTGLKDLNRVRLVMNISLGLTAIAGVAMGIAGLAN